jgi:hypothetical protein
MLECLFRGDAFGRIVEENSSKKVQELVIELVLSIWRNNVLSLNQYQTWQNSMSKTYVEIFHGQHIFLGCSSSLLVRIVELSRALEISTTSRSAMPGLM